MKARERSVGQQQSKSSTKLCSGWMCSYGTPSCSEMIRRTFNARSGFVPVFILVGMSEGSPWSRQRRSPKENACYSPMFLAGYFLNVAPCAFSFPSTVTIQGSKRCPTVISSFGSR